MFAEIHDRELADRLDPADIAAAVRVISALTAHTREVARRRGDDHGPKGELIEIGGSAHMPNMERPADVNQAVLEFITQ